MTSQSGDDFILAQTDSMNTLTIFLPGEETSIYDFDASSYWLTVWSHNTELIFWRGACCCETRVDPIRLVEINSAITAHGKPTTLRL